VNQITPNPAKQLTIQKSLQVLCSEDNDLKYLAQRSIISFVRNIAHMSDKKVFDIKKIDLKKLSESYGLVQTPVLEESGSDKDEEDDESEEEVPGGQVVDTVTDQTASFTRNQRKLLRFKEKLRAKKGLTGEIDAAAVTKNINNQLNATRETQLVKRVDNVLKREEEDADLFTLKKREDLNQASLERPEEWKVSKRQLKKIKPSGIYGGRNIYEIDDDLKIIPQEDVRKEEWRKNLAQAETSGVDLAKVYASKLQQNVDLDKAEEIGRLKEQRRKRKAKTQPQEPKDQSD